MNSLKDNMKTKKSNTNTVIFELIDNVLIVSNNGEPFSIEGVESLMLPYYTAKAERESKKTFTSPVINSQIMELLEKQRSLYRDYPERIQSDYSTEYNTVGEYHGREILELLQNCIDAMPGDSTFQIGAKGLGFRSLLNWCKKIKIYSGELSIAFGFEEAEIFRKSINVAQKIAILSAPVVIEPIKLNYTTQIVLQLKESVINDVESQLLQIDERSMVFLPKIEELIIRTTNSERSYRKIDDQTGNVLIYATVDGVATEYLWQVFNQEKRSVSLNDIDGKKKDYSYGISIAFCDDLPRLTNNYLYSYFKTKVEFPLGWLCHADFELRSDRNDIIEHPLNTLILQELVSLIDESSEKITETVKNPENALKSIVPAGPFLTEIAGFKFSEYYYTNIGKKRVLPTINGGFISLFENPWYTNTNYPALFAGDGFKKLLKYINDKDAIDFIKRIAARDKIDLSISIQNIQSSINELTSKWSPEECFTVFEWWRTTYGNIPDALSFLPNLIRLENGQWATGKDKVYFKVGEVPIVPSWVTFSFLSDDFQKAAINFYKSEDGYLAHKDLRTEPREERTISDYAIIEKNPFFRYLDRSTTIARVNNSVGDNWTYSQEFVLWLYKYYNDKEDWTPPTEVIFNFPSQNNEVVRPDTLYFGEYYNNDLSKICAMQDGQKELWHFSILLEDKERFIEFCVKFGVRLVPVREQVSFYNWQIPKSYKEELYSHISYPLQLDHGTVAAKEEVMRTDFEFVNITADSYKNLGYILSNANFSDLLLWISKDDLLKKSLLSRFETSVKYPLYAKRKEQRDGRAVHCNQVRNYIAHMFATSKWIELDGERFSPEQIVLDEKIGKQLAPRLLGQNIDQILPPSTAVDYEINAIIDNLGFIIDFSKIKPSVLYTILNELSNDGIDRNGDLSKKIYIQIMNASGLKEPDANCHERTKFLQNGKVFCYDNCFHSISEVYYADKSFPDKVRENHTLIHLRKNRGAKKAELWFGVKEFKPDMKVSYFLESVFNKSFQKDLHEVLKGLYVENSQTVTDEKRWKTVKKLRIVLVSSMTIRYDDSERNCENYQYAKDSTGQFILMIGTNSPDKYDEHLTSTLFEIIRMTINIEETTLGISFRDLWKYPTASLRNALVQRHENDTIWNDADNFFDGDNKVISSIDNAQKNKEMFNKCKDSNELNFKKILYNKLLTSTIDEQKLYLAKIKEYKQIEPNLELLKEDFCNVLDLLQSIKPADILLEKNYDIDIDVDALGFETKKCLFERYPQNTSELNNFLVNEYDSLLRFGNYEYLQQEFEKYLTESELIEEPNYEVIPRTLNFIDSSNFQLSRINSNHPKNNTSSKSGNPYKDYSAKQASNTRTGKKSEEIVYEHLIQRYGKENVEWMSQFAREENINLDGSDSYGYDMHYTDAEEKIYVEVKTNSSHLPNITFSLTEFERNFAEIHTHYKIFVVTEPKSIFPDIIAFNWDKIKVFANTPTGYVVEFKQEDKSNM